ncbi:MAG: DUF853 domain-containing protein, partial [Thermoanaerobaculia bacterium]|nr:DUF853 domain-containing protein [Thermoanaerobaculia bacterium]
MANELFLGRSVTKAPAPLALDPDDLMTHGLIVGMTGSGKTALGILLIEELLKQGIPVLAIDPKGDLGNLALAFPRLAPDEFAPWVPGGGEATPEGEARKWSEGLAGWGITAADVASYAASRSVTIFTPGSTAGVQVDLLGALAPPPDGAQSEEGRDLMTAFLGGLLGLLGRDADPVSSRDFILLARCVEEIWAKGETATLESLVGAAAQPPFGAIGALPLETFFPKKERDGLVLGLNSLLASPATAAFRGGVPLDIDVLLGRALHILDLAPLRPRASLRRRDAPLSRPLLAPLAARLDVAAGAGLHRRDLRVLPAVGRAADEEASPLAPEAGARVRRRDRPGHAEPGRPRLQGAGQLRLLVGRHAPDRARQEAPRRRPHRRRGPDGRRRAPEPDEEADLPPPRRPPEGTRDLRDPLGDELPARPDDARRAD